MTHADFLTALEHQLQLRGIAFSRAALVVFVESCWPLIEDDPNVEFWSQEFVETSGVSQLPVPQVSETLATENRLANPFALSKIAPSE